VKPKDSRAVYGLGNLYSDQQRWEEAEAAYRAALQIEPVNSISHIALSYVLTQPIAVPNLSDRYDEAEKLARRAIQLAPTNALAFDQLGVALELRGLIGAETENAYRRAIQLDSSFAPAHAHLGRLLRRRGLLQESAAAYQDAIRRSTDVATMILVAEVMQSEQRFVESEQLLRKALQNDSKNHAALLMLGRALTTQGKYSDAEQVLKSSLEVSTKGFAANSLLGSLYARQGKFELAENALLQALRFVSALEKRRLSQQFEAVGDGYLKTGKARNAARSYRQAITLDSYKETLAGKLAKAQRG
jgi:tetratricopeptide (TPR) repeat protein